MVHGIVVCLNPLQKKLDWGIWFNCWFYVFKLFSDQTAQSGSQTGSGPLGFGDFLSTDQ